MIFSTFYENIILGLFPVISKKMDVGENYYKPNIDTFVKSIDIISHPIYCGRNGLKINI
jgi:hypothetical protein